MKESAETLNGEAAKKVASMVGKKVDQTVDSVFDAIERGEGSCDTEQASMPTEGHTSNI